MPAGSTWEHSKYLKNMPWSEKEEKSWKYFISFQFDHEKYNHPYDYSAYLQSLCHVRFSKTYSVFPVNQN